MLPVLLKFEIESALTRSWGGIFLRYQVRLLRQRELLLRGLGDAWLAPARALIRLHGDDGLVRRALRYLGIEDLLQIRLLLQLLPDLFEWFHALIRWLFRHLSLSASTRTEIDLSLWAYLACLISDVLNNLMSPVAQTTTLDLGILTWTCWLWIERCAVWRDFLTNTYAAHHRLLLFWLLLRLAPTTVESRVTRGCIGAVLHLLRVVLLSHWARATSLISLFIELSVLAMSLHGRGAATATLFLHLIDSTRLDHDNSLLKIGSYLIR